MKNVFIGAILSAFMFKYWVFVAKKSNFVGLMGLLVALSLLALKKNDTHQEIFSPIRYTSTLVEYLFLIDVHFRFTTTHK